MRHIGIIATDTQARKLADFLLIQGVKTQVEQEADGFHFWAIDEDRIPSARQIIAEFQANPSDPRYDVAAEASRLRVAEVKKAREAARRHIDLRNRWQGESGGMPRMTVLLIAASVLISVGSKFGDDESPVLQACTMASYERQGNYVTWRPALAEIREGQVWRLVTPIFIHFGALHLLFNMMWMWSLGSAIELRRGWWRMALLVLFLAIGSNLAQYGWVAARPGGFPPGFGGMSGVIAGLFGYVWIRSRVDPASGFFMDTGTVYFMIGWLVICGLGWMGPIANAAHFGGLGLGCAMGALPLVGRRLRRR